MAHLPALAGGDEGAGADGVRHDWGRTLTELVDERFLAPLHDWARARTVRVCACKPTESRRRARRAVPWSTFRDGEGAPVARAHRLAMGVVCRAHLSAGRSLPRKHGPGCIHPPFARPRST